MVRRACRCEPYVMFGLEGAIPLDEGLASTVALFRQQLNQGIVRW